LYQRPSTNQIPYLVPLFRSDLMAFSNMSSFWISIAVAGISPSLVAALDLPGGVSFGATIPEVLEIAHSHGWDLKQTTFNSNTWSDDANGLTFYFCDQHLTSVDTYLDGNLRTYVETVWTQSHKWGEPKTEAYVISPGSELESYGVNSVFDLGQGKTLNVQIYTNDRGETVWTRKSDSSICE